MRERTDQFIAFTSDVIYEIFRPIIRKANFIFKLVYWIGLSYSFIIEEKRNKKSFLPNMKKFHIFLSIHINIQFFPHQQFSSFTLNFNWNLNIRSQAIYKSLSRLFSTLPKYLSRSQPCGYRFRQIMAHAQFRNQSINIFPFHTRRETHLHSRIPAS